MENHPKDRLADGEHDLVFAEREKRGSWDGAWVPVGSQSHQEGYMYSAFYDDRKSLQTLPMIRVIAVMEDLGNNPRLFCALYYKAGNKIEYLQLVATKIGVGVVIMKTVPKYIEYILVCPMSHEEIPDRVGIVSTPGVRTTAMIPVEVLERMQSTHNFGMCISVSYWDQNPYRIVEWLEMLRILGVNGVTVYNNSLKEEAADVFLEYAKEGFVDFRQSHNFIADDTEYAIHMHMSPVINDCMYRNMFKYEHIVVTDWDELIIPRSADNYQEMIKEINTDHPKDLLKHYMFRNNYFFLDLPGEDKSQSPYLITLQHRQKVAVSESGYAIKSIIDPRACSNMHNHYCWIHTGSYMISSSSVIVNPKYGLNQHYKRCHFDTMLNHPVSCKQAFKEAIQDDVMLLYKERLENLVVRKLHQLQMIAGG